MTKEKGAPVASAEFKIRLSQEQYLGAIGAMYFGDTVTTHIDQLVSMCGTWDNVHELSDTIKGKNFSDARQLIKANYKNDVNTEGYLDLRADLLLWISQYIARISGVSVAEFYALEFVSTPTVINSVLLGKQCKKSDGGLRGLLWEDVWDRGCWLFVTSIAHVETMLVEMYKQQHPEDLAFNESHVKAMVDATIMTKPTGKKNDVN